LPAYRLPSPYDRPPLRRRASGLALALGVNLLLLLVLLGIGRFTPIAQKVGPMAIFNLAPESRRSERRKTESVQARRETKLIPKPPPIVLPVKPTIAPPPEPLKDKTSPWVELSRDEMAAADVSNLPNASAGSGESDSEEVGRGPHGEVLYAVEWARHPTSAELGGYLPHDPPDGWGEIACRTIPDNRVDDCVEIDQLPHGSHLAGAVRRAAWQFHIRPPRKNGKPMIGQWILIHIDYSFSRRDSESGQ
jgi:protein TonB